MSQDIPDPTELVAGEKDALIREMYEQLQSLGNRVDDLEEDNSQLVEQCSSLEQDVTTLKKKVTTLENENASLKERTANLEGETRELRDLSNAASARADALYEGLEQAQADITDQSFHAENRLSELTKRVAGLESELGLEDWETASSVSPNACALERFATMPDDRRDAELKAPVARATLVWEHFDDWSSPTHKGRVIRSGELRKLLKAVTGRKLAWTQVYRVMEEFEENTTAQYQYIGSDGENDAIGKALIRLRDFNDDEAQVATDGGYEL